MPKDALLEIGTEEIPSGMLSGAEQQLRGSAEAFLTENRLTAKKIATFSTPRRLAILLEQLPEKSADNVKEITGPKASVWKDAQGDFTQAAQGFAKSHGLSAAELMVVHTPKGDYLCATVKELGERTEKILAKFFPKLISSLSFPKSMVWEASRFRFARPIRNIVALYGSKVISFQVAGVKAGKTSFGLGVPGKKVEIASPARYESILANQCILADSAERRKALQKSAEHVVQKIKVRMRLEADLVHEVAGLVEHPVAILGHFDKEYLSLPREILESVLNQKQKFFAVEDSEGQLLPYFVGIRNGISVNQDVVREGFERVLAARLNDAAFFFKQDTQSKLEKKVEKLQGIVFHASLNPATKGQSTSVLQKVERMKALAGKLCEHLNELDSLKQHVERAVWLSKADLTTELVGEYPELQGVIGGIYGEHDGEPQAVAQAVRGHYQPISQQDKIPQTTEGQLVALSDKMDNLVVRFLDGYVPTGDADPFALRRSALGILRILRESPFFQKHPITIRQLLGAGDWSGVPSVPPQETWQKDLVHFLKQRYRGILEEEKFRFDEINAVLDDDWAAKDLPDLESRLKALHNIRQDSDFEPLSVAYKRAANILKQARDKNIRWNDRFLQEGAQAPEERDLYGQLQLYQGKSEELLRGREYENALKEMVGLRPKVDAFFDKVMVMVDDEAIRSNRLALMKMIQETFGRIADFSALQQEDSKNS